MKLAFCLFKYFPYGGMQRDFLRIAKECVRRGHHVEVYTMSWEGERPNDFIIHEIPTKSWQNHTRSQQFVRALQQKFHHHAYDLIIGFNKMPGLDLYYAADTCYQMKAKQQRGYWYRFTPRYRHLIQFEDAVFNKNAHTKILLLSKLQQTEFINCYQTNAERFHLLPPGIEKNRIAPNNLEEIRATARKQLHIKNNELLLLMIGSGFKTKGLDRALIGIQHLPESIKNRVRFFVIGKDNPKSFLKLAKQLNIQDRVKFLGGRDDVPQFLFAADLLLHPAYNENTGTVLLEALVSGLPVLTTEVCGYAEHIKNANAGIVLTSPFEQNIFNQALTHMLSSPQQTIWRSNGLLYAKQHDLYSLVERAVDVIESVRSQRAA